MPFLSWIFGDANLRYLRSIAPLALKINSLEPDAGKLSEEDLKSKTAAFKERFLAGETLDDLLPEAFALVREAAKRTLNQRHFDEQLAGGIALHQGKIAQMATGEGKTLTATLAVYLNALSGESAHVITVNDYLARRDTVWMGQIYDALGLTVGCINPNDQSYVYDPRYKNAGASEDKARDSTGSFMVFHDFLRPASKKEAYDRDVVYGTNTEFGFDYLRDNLATDLSRVFGGSRSYAIVDEVDSILIDEARTPLIISVPDAESPRLYATFSKIVPRLSENEDYNVDLKMRTAIITEEGLNKVEKMLGVDNIYDEKGARYVHHLEQALRAEALFHRDKDYVVKDGEVIIVDEFTGRLLEGRRYSEGLHQAIEAKEGVMVKQESRTLATITFQNFFRLYKKLAGMTGTAATSAEEFYEVYKLSTAIIPTHKPMIRQNLPDKIYKTEEAKFRAVVSEVAERNAKGQPVLIGTISIDKNEKLSRMLSRAGIKHELLNAKQHEREALIHAQAGRLASVTVATNMAGRGVDIILGGNPQDPGESQKVRDLGGLHVIGTERHESRRIDDQLRGRSGRQGDPGSSQFFVSLEDDLMRIFGGERIKNLMETLKIPEDQPIEANLVSKAITTAQSKVEGFNFDIRKHVLEYDNVMNSHRLTVYKKRNEILAGLPRETALNLLKKQVRGIIDFHTETGEENQWNKEEIFENLRAILPIGGGEKEFLAKIKSREEALGHFEKLTEALYEAKEKNVGADTMRQIERLVMLNTLDNLWMNHLEDMEYLRDSVRLRAYGQRDPLVEYKNEGHRLFNQFLANFEAQIAMVIFKVSPVPQPAASASFESRPIKSLKEIGRNDPCPCGATYPDGKSKKYKDCHGRNA